MIGKLDVYVDKKGPLDSTVRSGYGTCFKYENYIVTAYHVIEGYSHMEIIHDNIQYDCKVIALCPEFDIAILDSQAPLEEFTLSLNVSLGDHIEISGFPSGSIGPVITTGSISGVITEKCGIGYTTSAHIYYGMSGGPVINDNREVVGVVTMLTTVHNFYESIISPSFHLNHLIKMIEEHPKKGNRPGLFQGLTYFPVRTSMYGRNIIVVQSKESTIHVGDVLTKINDVTITDGLIELGQFKVPYVHKLSISKPGEIVKFTLIRKGKEMHVKLKMTLPKGYVIPGCYEELRESDYKQIGPYIFTRFSWVLLNELKSDSPKIANILSNYYMDEMEPIMLCLNKEIQWARLIKQKKDSIDIIYPKLTLFI